MTGNLNLDIDLGLASLGAAQSTDAIRARRAGVDGVVSVSGLVVPAGSSTQVQYNNAGAFGGMAGTVWTAANQALAITSLSGAPLTLTPAANASALSLTGLSLTGSNASALLDMSGTWNTSGAPAGIKLNLTNTASGAGARLLDLQVSSSSKFSVSAAGVVTLQTATAGLIAGSGTSGANHALGATAGNALEFYLNATHTTGDMRGEYIRLYFSGAGGSGEALRAYSTINNVSVATGGTVNGAHISLGTAGASAAVSGQASALRATFEIAAASTAVGGTCSVAIFDTNMDTAVTVPANFAFLRFVNLGAKKSNNLIRIPNVAAESGGLFCVHTTQVMTHSIKIVSENGTPYYIMCTDATTNRTEA